MCLLLRDSMGIHSLWMVGNLWEIARIHYLHDCVPSRSLAGSPRRVETRERPIKIRTCQLRIVNWCSLSRVCFFSKNKVSSHEFPFFCDSTFRKLRYCAWWIWKKELYLGRTCLQFIKSVYEAHSEPFSFQLVLFCSHRAIIRRNF